MVKLLYVLLIITYVIFAHQLMDLLRRKQYAKFLLRLLLAPVIFLFDWPIARRDFPRPGEPTKKPDDRGDHRA